MSEQWLVPGALVALVLLALVLLVLLVRDRRRVRAELAASRAETAELRDLVEAGLAARGGAAGRPATEQPGTEVAEFVITGVAAEAEREEGRSTEVATHTGRIEGRLFADILFRETLVRAAAAAGGVRRALAPETRNRIRFEIRREVKRSRKQRRAELREARRLLHAQQRASIDPTGQLPPRDTDEDAA